MPLENAGHCSDLTLYKQDRTMEGDLGDVVEALLACDAAQQLAELEEKM